MSAAIFAVVVVALVAGSGVLVGRLLPCLGFWVIPINVAVGAFEGWLTIRWLLRRRGR